MTTSYGICHRCKKEVRCNALVVVVYETELGKLRGYECEPCSVIDDFNINLLACKDCAQPVVDEGCYYCKDCM